MVFREETYRVAVISASEQFNNNLGSLLNPGEYYPITYLQSAGEARRYLAQKEVDFVIINAPLPDEFGTRLAVDCCRDSDSAVALFVRREVYPEVFSRVTQAGVLTIPKPVSTQLFTHDLLLMQAMRERLRVRRKQQMTMEEKMTQIRLVNKAKWKLIENLEMTEEAAHHFIEKQAMNSQKTRKEIAEEILEEEISLEYLRKISEHTKKAE